MGGPNYVYKNIDRARGPNPSPLARFLGGLINLHVSKIAKSPTPRQTPNRRSGRAPSISSAPHREDRARSSSSQEHSARPRSSTIEHTRRALLVCSLPATCRRRRKSNSAALSVASKRMQPAHRDCEQIGDARRNRSAAASTISLAAALLTFASHSLLGWVRIARFRTSRVYCTARKGAKVNCVSYGGWWALP